MPDEARGVQATAETAEGHVPRAMAGGSATFWGGIFHGILGDFHGDFEHGLYIYGILVGSGEISMILFMIKNYGISGWEWDLMGVFSGGTFWEKPLGCLS